MDRLLLALDVNEKLWSFSSDIRFSWVEDGSHRQVTGRHHWPYSTFTERPEFADFAQASELTKTIDAIYSKEPDIPYHAVRTALDALQLGSYAFSASIRFLQEAIALEALCSGADSEVTHRVATSCAILIGVTFEERKAIYKQARGLYGIRSRIIHGSGARARVDELRQIGQLTRKVVRRILSSDVLPNYETSKKQREFLLKLSLEKSLTS